MMEKRIDRVIFTCGGTAGHVNPAIAVAQLLAEKNPDVKILFVGAERGLEKDLIPKAGYDFRTVHISSFHRSFKPAEIRHNLVSLFNMVRSPAEAKAILRGLAVHWVRAVISARSRFTVRGQVQYRRLRALRSSRMVRSVPPGVRMRRVWVTSRPSGRDMVTTMLEVMTNTSIRTAP